MNLVRRLRSYLERKRMIVSDFPDFVWLKRAIATAGFHPGNLFLIKQALLDLPEEGVIVEIGAYAGFSTILIKQLMKSYDIERLLISCDPYQLEMIKNRLYKESKKEQEKYESFIEQSCIHNISAFCSDNPPNVIKLNSNDFFRAWANNEVVEDLLGNKVQLGGKIAFSYIDGNHKYEVVKQDFLNIHNHLVDGGLILFDDSGDFVKKPEWGAGPNGIVKEAIKTYHYNIYLKNINYLIIKENGVGK